jgi:hypothetical protein
MLESKESKPPFRGGPLCRARGPYWRLESEIVHRFKDEKHRDAPMVPYNLRATATDTIFLEGLNCASCDSFVASETSEVVAGKI